MPFIQGSAPDRVSGCGGGGNTATGGASSPKAAGPAKPRPKPETRPAARDKNPLNDLF